MVDKLTKQKEDMQKFQETEMLKHLDLKYKNEIIRSMEWLAKKDDTIFLCVCVCVCVCVAVPVCGLPVCVCL